MSETLTPSKQRLAHAILDFLSNCAKDGTLPSADDKEQIDVARTCISEAFKISLDDTAAVQDAVGDQSLMSIYSVYEKLKGKSTASTPEGKSSAESGRPSTPSTPNRTHSGSNVTAGSMGSQAAGINPEAEKLKSQGNDAMKKKDYKEAIEKYTAAISLSPTNPIYLSNRAAAYSATGDNAAAAADAEIAVAADPKYVKAWSRLGLAKYALGDARGAAEAYSKGIEYEGGGGSEAMRKGLETAQNKVKEMEKEEENDLPDQEVDDAATTGRGAGGPGGGGMPDLASLAGMFGGGGGGGGRGAGGGGGMPDLSSIMNNPMMRNMAQNLMSNPDQLRNLMSNPQVQNMMNGLRGGGEGGGGGMPDLGSLMNDPSMREMAQNFMGGMGRGAGRGT
ncbi:MAG: hypothetical protein Q9227_008252 [Pyrenula ochraceoflavens]